MHLDLVGIWGPPVCPLANSLAGDITRPDNHGKNKLVCAVCVLKRL